MTLTLTINEPSIYLSTTILEGDSQDMNLLYPAELTPACYSCTIVGVPLLDSDDVVQMPLAVFVTNDDDGVHAENEELTIFGCGHSFAEAINELITSLSLTWAGLKDSTDDELTPDAVELRDRLAWYVGRSGDSKNG